PEVRLLADAPGGGGLVVYDGGGGRLVLPPGLPPNESLPLIVVGPNRALQLRNVRIVNCASLPSCLSLGAGARFVAREEDGVRMVLAAPELEREYASALAAAAAAVAASKAAAAAPQQQQQQQDVATAAAAAVQPPVFELHVDALGAAVHVIESYDKLSAALDDGGGNGKPLSGSSRYGSAPNLAAAGVASGGSRRALTEAATDGTTTASSRLRRRLVIELDAAASYHTQGPQQSATAAVRGLTIRTVTTFGSGQMAPPATPSPPSARGTPPLSKVSSAASLTTAAAAVQQAPPPPPLLAFPATAPAAASVTTTLLDPADVSARYTLTPTSQDISLDLGSLNLQLSPAALHLLLQLQGMVLQPLTAPPPDQPLARCNRFQRLWSSYRPRGASVAGLELGVGGIDTLAEDRGLSLWRPQPQPGYISLGDVLVSGSRMPYDQVATLAVNSGLVAFPMSYDLIWVATDGSVAIWRPVPPPGYVALGCLAGEGIGGGEGGSTAVVPPPPPLSAVGCVAERACVEGRLGECLPAGEGDVRLWGLQNEGATFEVATAGTHLPAGPLYDLRSPLGVPPAALTPLPDLLPPSMTAAAPAPAPTATTAATTSATSAMTSAAAAAASGPGTSSGAVGRPPVVPLGLVRVNARRREVPRGLGAGAAGGAGGEAEEEEEGVGATSLGGLLAAQPPPLSLLCQQRYMRVRRSLLSRAASAASQLPCVEFQRLWWDQEAAGGGGGGGGSHLSFWRPKPPP
ncbi:hypothetical protein Agub_g14845, partial [Astrephomene gubernaculifera]